MFWGVCWRVALYCHVSRGWVCLQHVFRGTCRAVIRACPSAAYFRTFAPEPRPSLCRGGGGGGATLGSCGLWAGVVLCTGAVRGGGGIPQHFAKETSPCIPSPPAVVPCLVPRASMQGTVLRSGGPQEDCRCRAPGNRAQRAKCPGAAPDADAAAKRRRHGGRGQGGAEAPCRGKGGGGGADLLGTSADQR